jgi:uncharacterized protein (DUF302 family)
VDRRPLDPAAVTLERADSPNSVTDTADRIVAALQSRGIGVFARVDHAGGARKVGLELPDEQLLIFGDPRSGTGLMQEDASVGYELPLRMLVWDDGGQTRIGWRPPPDLASDYSLAQHAQVLAKMEGLLEQLAAEGAGGS